MQNKLPIFKDSPGLNYFRHWLMNEGLIAAVDARIYYNLEPSEHGGLAVKGVAVSFFPKNRMRELGYSDHPIYEEQHAVYRGRDGYSYHSGNVYDEWMNSGDVKSPPPYPEDTCCNVVYGPTEEFEGLCWFGFENEQDAKQALEQFAHIEECTWARDGSIDPASLVKTVATRKSEAEIHKIKRWIYAEENKRCRREFENEVKRQMASGEMKKCPKNVDMYFESMRLKPETAETNPQYLELKEQWDALREKMINERDMRIKKRDWNAEQEIRAYHIYEIEEEIRADENKQKEKAFDEIKNQKISNGEWVVPEGVSVFGTGLMISGSAAHWDENAPVNILSRQLDELKIQIFGE